MGIRSVVAAAVVAVGMGQAAEAAAGRCEYSDHYDPPIFGERAIYDFDLYFKEGFIGGEENQIDSWGIYTKDSPVHMRMTTTYLPADYCADISLSSQGQAWTTTSSIWDFAFYAWGISPDGADFFFHFTPEDDKDSYLDLMYYNGEQPAWVLLAIDNIQLAAVPLPETAALLPIGLGALAILRRRRSVPNGAGPCLTDDHHQLPAGDHHAHGQD